MDSGGYRGKAGAGAAAGGWRGRGRGIGRSGQDGSLGRGRSTGRSGGDHQYHTRQQFYHQQQQYNQQMWVSSQDGRGSGRYGGLRPTRGAYGGHGGEGRGRGWCQYAVPVQSQMELQRPSPESLPTVQSQMELRRPSPESLPTVQSQMELQRTFPETLPCDSPIVPEMQSLQISGQSPSSSSSSTSPPEVAGKLIPMKRPDNGGKKDIRRISLHANHFRVKYNPETIIRHYDIDVKLDMPTKNNLPTTFSKTVLSAVRDKLFSDDPTRFPSLSMTAYDGEKNIFSTESLPTGKFKLELSNEEGSKIQSFKVQVQLVNELKYEKLDSYLSGLTFTIPRDVLQAMDVVTKENPTKQMIYVGKSFHSTRPYLQVDLGRGVIASEGIKHSLKTTSQGAALCLDYSVLPLRKPMPVIDYLREDIRGFDLNNFASFRKKVENALKGLKVTVTHRSSNHRYKIAALTDENVQDICFDLEDLSGDQIPLRRVSLVEYFKEKYSKDIMYKDIPCLDLGKSNRKIYVPMEFCAITAGQRYGKERLEKYQAEKLRKISLAPPKVRESTIYGMIRSGDGPCGGGICKNFGIEADMNMTSVIGRVIEPPELKLGTSRGRWMKATVDRRKCDWNLNRNSVISSKPITVWGVIDFGTFSIERFIPDLISRCYRLNINMEKPVFYKRLQMGLLYEADNLHQLLENVKDESFKIGGSHLQILLCVLPEQDPGYNNLKWISETKVGILTQCCLSANANKSKDQFLANVALKINAKLGGSNMELLTQPQCLQSKSHVMFIGVDSNRPGPLNATSPSIAAVVATMNWPAANQYATRICPQDNRAEKILKIGTMCLQLVNTYAQLNQVRPDKIVLFRDGVSDNQFDMVLNEELRDIKRTFRAQNYFPTITIVVAQKRHTTRLFLDGDREENVPPGTVVDTKITSLVGFDFYLCSHFGHIGTSKPAHYHVLWDENDFTSDQLQELIYGMCFTSAQCTKPVSLVPPVCYADRAAYRGRLYHDSIEWDHSSASSSSSSKASFDEKFYRLHPNLENSMFFI
ncbi:hypothetical protein JCGZ_00220 [Jatropha curcas]|uniref:Uncharacterized protein n=2 Tax=Jatropha curcas TaxID=180498 RepID=A0A067L5B4_JATCU|nr:hypothetical protein JCGZ_00220 [Jatropha curcas]